MWGSKVFGKAKELIDGFVSFCKKMGGTASVKDTGVSYIMSCVLPRKRSVAVDLFRDALEVTVDAYSYRLESENLPKTRKVTFGNLINPVKVTGTAVIDASLKDSFHVNEISDSFGVVVDKDFKEMYVFIPML